MAFNFEHKQLPEKPGVYMMVDSLGNIILESRDWFNLQVKIGIS
jgi:hypothetical protein